ncbi:MULTISPECIES: hypothetical protein [Polaromonas]|uniref:Uncharacterized protein n=1 Tax=Polaromonas aquatica TaxID=332657 RepID=A0ABW1U1A5_9BURK
MTKKAIFDRFSWNWNYAETPQNVEAHYSKSELVREFLVLHAFSGSRLSQVDRLEHAVAIAFDKVCRGIKQGLIELDYVPCESDRMNIPAIEHPHHMQALLYWCAQLGCTLHVLVDAYSTLGSTPSVESIRAKVWQLWREGASCTRPPRNFGLQQRDAARTRYEFADTRTMVRQ